MQEVTFYEDGEPMIDGEAGDLRVSAFPIIYLIVVVFAKGFENPYFMFNSSASTLHPTTFSEGKAMTCILLSPSPW